MNLEAWCYIKVGGHPKEWLELKLSLFQGNPQNNDQIVTL